MSNARSRKRQGLNKGGVIIIGGKNLKKTKNKKRRKHYPLTRYITFSDEATSEGIERYWNAYTKQEHELSKNRKYSRQNKGIQKPYEMHHSIKNLTDCN
jgi:hypothetical protein